jgi:hypothetical protein
MQVSAGHGNAQENVPKSQRIIKRQPLLLNYSKLHNQQVQNERGTVKVSKMSIINL